MLPRVTRHSNNFNNIRLNFEISTRACYFSAMVLEFSKMNGAGNDFLLIDNRQQKIALDTAQITRLCHRQQGVGADGVILLRCSASGCADWAWDFFNNDGSAAEMCGNGARCFARFVQKTTGVGGKFTFETGAGIIQASLDGTRVTVSLTKPRNLRLNEAVALSIGKQSIHSLDTGVPHAVLFVPDADQAMVQQLGREIRRHAHFAPRGTNVNFVQRLGPGSIRVRTYERGVESETLACGTGVTASALVTATLHQFESPVKVKVQSGSELEVSFQRNNGEFTEVRLTGPADFVFEGKLEL
jgi:diaminopimelate epimerase